MSPLGANTLQWQYTCTCRQMVGGNLQLSSIYVYYLWKASLSDLLYIIQVHVAWSGFKWYTMEYPTCHLYFFEGQMTLLVTIYQENTSGKSHGKLQESVT